MSDASLPPQTPPLVRNPQDLVAGMILVAVAGFTFWATRGLAIGTLNEVGPGFMPKVAATAITIMGVALVALAFWKSGEAFEHLSWRAPLVITLALFAFAGLIRPFGLLPASLVLALMSGFTAPDVRYRELIIFSVVLSAACCVLFKYGFSMQVDILTLDMFRGG